MLMFMRVCMYMDMYVSCHVICHMTVVCTQVSIINKAKITSLCQGRGLCRAYDILSL